MALRLVTGPTEGLITLEAAKAQLRLDDACQDVLVAGLIDLAGREIESWTQRRYLAQTVAWIRDDWSGRMRLPIAPGWDVSDIAVASIAYVDAAGVTQTLPADQYWARPCGHTLELVPREGVCWPMLGDGAERVVMTIVITGAAAAAPETVKQAAKLIVQREFDGADRPAFDQAIRNLLQPETWA